MHGNANSLAALVRSKVAERTRTDKHLSFWKGLLFSILTLGIYGFYEFYWMVKRRDLHIARFYDLADAFIGWANSEAQARRVDLRYELEALRSAVSKRQPARNARLWLLLWLIAGPVVFYAWYFLNDDFLEHERQEEAFYQAAQDALYRLRATSRPRPGSCISTRRIRFFWYLVLSLLTFGIFGIYWHYRLIEDPNRHFRANVALEDWLLEAVERGGF